jgi:CheY-like chemotaxis protein
VTEAQAGLEQARQLEPAVVLVDIVLSEGSGWELIRHLQADPQTQKLPLVVISAADERSQAAHYGLRGYVLKPLDRDKLVATIEEARRSQTRPSSILVVDDDKVMRDLLALQLAGFGYQCQQAASGDEALELLRTLQHLPGVLVLDLKMSLGSGFEVLQKVRLNPRTAALPVLVVTSLSLNEAERNYLQANGAHVIFKQNLSENGLAEHIRLLTN